MQRTEKSELPEIHSWNEVPNFQSEAEEAEFWSNHGLGDEILTDLRFSIAKYRYYQRRTNYD